MVANAAALKDIPTEKVSMELWSPLKIEMIFDEISFFNHFGDQFANSSGVGFVRFKGRETQSIHVFSMKCRELISSL